MKTIAQITAAAAVAVAFAVPANAATVTFGPFPTAAEMNPTADATTGTVFENVIGSVSGLRRSPWQGSAIDENAADSFYTSVSGNSSATYSFGVVQRSLSFLWGSPDTYNDLDIILSGGGSTVTVNGADAQGPVAIGAQFVTITDVGAFDTVTFRSGRNAFEFANFDTAQVPVPAALPLMVAGLAGLGIASRRRRNKKA